MTSRYVCFFFSSNTRVMLLFNISWLEWIQWWISIASNCCKSSLVVSQGISNINAEVHRQLFWFSLQSAFSTLPFGCKYYIRSELKMKSILFRSHHFQHIHKTSVGLLESGSGTEVPKSCFNTRIISPLNGKRWSGSIKARLPARTTPDQNTRPLAGFQQHMCVTSNVER